MNVEVFVILPRVCEIRVPVLSVSPKISSTQWSCRVKQGIAQTHIRTDRSNIIFFSIVISRFSAVLATLFLMPPKLRGQHGLLLPWGGEQTEVGCGEVGCCTAPLSLRAEPRRAASRTQPRWRVPVLVTECGSSSWKLFRTANLTFLCPLLKFL